MKMISSIESISNIVPHKQGNHKFYNMGSAPWNNSGFQTLEGRNHYIGKIAENS